jgi:hypothetical protein
MSDVPHILMVEDHREIRDLALKVSLDHTATGFEK